ncbi:MAG: adenine phosphoribosyltransferase [Deltaproteobacteria bacterium]|nr:adenine phosphoribosyltransferase [Deltaproteobacteria bacterium]
MKSFKTKLEEKAEKLAEKVKNSIRSIPDFPKKGILFRDITTVLQDGKLFCEIIEFLSERYSSGKTDAVAVVESRGFLWGAALALKLEKGLALIRKPKKLPYKTVSASYQLEYGTDSLEMHIDAVKPGENVLIVDDLLATGGTAKAAVELVERIGGRVAGVLFIIELTDLNGREKLKGYDVFSLVRY